MKMRKMITERDLNYKIQKGELQSKLKFCSTLTKLFQNYFLKKLNNK